MSVRLDPKVVPNNKEMAMYTPAVAEDILLALMATGYDAKVSNVRVTPHDETSITLDVGGILFDINITINDF